MSMWRNWRMSLGAAGTLMVVLLCAQGALADKELASEVMAGLKRHYDWHVWGGVTTEPAAKVEEIFLTEEDFAGYGESVVMRWAGAKARTVYVLGKKEKVVAAISIYIFDTAEEAQEKLLKMTIEIPTRTYSMRVQNSRRVSARPRAVGDVCFYGLAGRPGGRERDVSGGPMSLLFSRHNVAVRIFANPGQTIEMAQIVDKKLAQAEGVAPALESPWERNVLGPLKERLDWQEWAGREEYPGERIRGLDFREEDFAKYGYEVRIHNTGEDPPQSCPVYILDEAGRTVSVVYIVLLESTERAQEDMLYPTAFSGYEYKPAERGGEFDVGDTCIYATVAGAEGETSAANLRGIIFTRCNAEVRISAGATGPDVLEIARFVDARLSAPWEDKRKSLETRGVSGDISEIRPEGTR